MIYDFEQLADLLPPVYVQRGMRYLATGHVLSVDPRPEAGMVTGRVRGSGSRIYQVKVHIEEDAGQIPIIHGHCSCPVGWNCKHVAAVLLAAGRSVQAASSTPGQPVSGRRLAPASGELPHALSNWLYETERLTARPDDPHCLLYLLRLETRAMGYPRVRVSGVKVRRLQSGGYGKPAPFNLRSHSQARFIQPDDRRIMALVAAQPMRGEVNGTVLDDELGVALLQAILACGRGHWQDQDGPRLVPGAPVAGTLNWRWQEDSRLHLVFEREQEREPQPALAPAPQHEPAAQELEHGTDHEQEHAQEHPQEPEQGLEGESAPKREAGPEPGHRSEPEDEPTPSQGAGAENQHAGLVLLPLSPPWYLDPRSGACGPIETPFSEAQATALVRAPAIPLAELEAFEQATRTRLKGLDLPPPPRPEQRTLEVEAPTPCLRLLSREVQSQPVYGGWGGYYGSTAQPKWEDEARLEYDYAGVRIDPHQPGERVEYIEDEIMVTCERNPAAERQAVDQLDAQGLLKLTDNRDEPGQPFAPAAVEDWLRFMDQGMPALEQAGWRIEVDPSFRFPVGRVGDWDLDIEEGEGGRWLDLSLGIEVDGERLDLLPILVNLIQNPEVDLSGPALARINEDTRFILRLDDGRYIFFPAARLKPILATLIELYDPMARLQGDGRMRLSRLQATELAELEQQAPELRWRGGEQARAWGRRLREFERIEPVAPPAELQADLRPYQQDGLNWLQFLRDFELGGVLADDMGLGKTIQALAHLLLERAAGRTDRPSLVVAPTSLMFNWKREAERFAPSLRVVILQGPKRQQHFDHLAEQDLVLTTYALLPRDLEVLTAQAWHLLILDEAQAIKNPRSKGAQAARALDARHRLCLTGTPLENHLGELWSLMDFLMPDLLGDERSFRRLFRNPIERHGEHERTEPLRRRIAPFLLRRTKEDVAAELPPKTEILREVALASDQRDLYETLRLALHEKVRKEIARKGLAQSGIIILDALLKLRQCCCDPRLVSLESARGVRGSAKLDLLMELLPELLQEGRRVLLFSQFTSMLSLIEEALAQRLDQKKGRDYVKLTGQTRDRETPVNRFQAGEVPLFLISLKAGGSGLNLTAADAVIHYKLTGQTRDRETPVNRFQAGEVPLFLISLKAGGSGLNLTAADAVIHYDPWWNPAAERQATDRAHRIGQDKPVFVYKLLTEGTVEQRVAELQARKQALADAMLEGGGTAAKSLTPEDLDLLFAPLEGSD